MFASMVPFFLRNFTIQCVLNREVIIFEITIDHRVPTANDYNVSELKKLSANVLSVFLKSLQDGGNVIESRTFYAEGR